LVVPRREALIQHRRGGGHEVALRGVGLAQHLGDGDALLRRDEARGRRGAETREGA
jgi:hypothetical protein